MSTELLSRRMDFIHTYSNGTHYLRMDTSYPVRLSGIALKMFQATHIYRSSGVNSFVIQNQDSSDTLVTIPKANCFDFKGENLTDNAFDTGDYVMAVIDINERKLYLCSTSQISMYLNPSTLATVYSRRLPATGATVTIKSDPIIDMGMNPNSYYNTYDSGAMVDMFVNSYGQYVTGFGWSKFKGDSAAIFMTYQPNGALPVALYGAKITESDVGNTVKVSPIDTVAPNTVKFYSAYEEDDETTLKNKAEKLETVYKNYALMRNEKDYVVNQLAEMSYYDESGQESKIKKSIPVSNEKTSTLNNIMIYNTPYIWPSVIDTYNPINNVTSIAYLQRIVGYMSDKFEKEFGIEYSEDENSLFYKLTKENDYYETDSEGNMLDTTKTKRHPLSIGLNHINNLSNYLKTLNNPEEYYYVLMSGYNSLDGPSQNYFLVPVKKTSHLFDIVVQTSSNISSNNSQIGINFVFGDEYLGSWFSGTDPIDTSYENPECKGNVGNYGPGKITYQYDHGVKYYITITNGTVYDLIIDRSQFVDDSKNDYEYDESDTIRYGIRDEHDSENYPIRIITKYRVTRNDEGEITNFTEINSSKVYPMYLDNHPYQFAAIPNIDNFYQRTAVTPKPPYEKYKYNFVKWFKDTQCWKLFSSSFSDAQTEMRKRNINSKYFENETDTISIHEFLVDCITKDIGNSTNNKFRDTEAKRYLYTRSEIESIVGVVKKLLDSDAVYKTDITFEGFNNYWYSKEEIEKAKAIYAGSDGNYYKLCGKYKKKDALGTYTDNGNTGHYYLIEGGSNTTHYSLANNLNLLDSDGKLITAKSSINMEAKFDSRAFYSPAVFEIDNKYMSDDNNINISVGTSGLNESRSISIVNEDNQLLSLSGSESDIKPNKLNWYDLLIALNHNKSIDLLGVLSQLKSEISTLENNDKITYTISKTNDKINIARLNTSSLITISEYNKSMAEKFNIIMKQPTFKKNSSGALYYYDFFVEEDIMYYYNDDGDKILFDNSIIEINGIPYVFDHDGTIMLRWENVNDKIYYYDPDNGNFILGWVTFGGNDYYVTFTEGKLTNKTRVIDGKTYVFDNDGIATEQTT